MFLQVHRLVLVESTALFDTARIDLKPHKAVKIKSRGKRESSFGCLCAVLFFFLALVIFFLCLCVQKVVCLVFLSPLYWIRTRSGFLGLECHSYCKRWDARDPALIDLSVTLRPSQMDHCVFLSLPAHQSHWGAGLGHRGPPQDPWSSHQSQGWLKDGGLLPQILLQPFTEVESHILL